MARRQVGAIHCAHPSGLLVRPSPQHRGPDSASMAAIMASLEARSGKTASPVTRAGSALNGAPRTRRAGDGKARKVAHRKCASSPQAQGCAFGKPRRPRAHPEHRDVLRTCSRGGLLFGDFLLAKQEKVTRAPGRGTEKDTDVEVGGRTKSKRPDLRDQEHRQRAEQRNQRHANLGEIEEAVTASVIHHCVGGIPHRCRE